MSIRPPGGRRSPRRMAIAGAAAAWQFVVGDDPVTALGIAVALAITALVAAAGLPAWPIAPVAMVALLHRLVRRAAIVSRTGGSDHHGAAAANVKRSPP